MALSKPEREQFLAEPHIAALSVAGAAGRAPLTVPIWYHYSPGGDAWVLTGARSRKAQLIEAAGRFSLMVDQVEPTARYVTVEGPVVGKAAGTHEHLWEISARYLPTEKVPEFVEWAGGTLGEQVRYTIRPEHWLSADMGAV